MDNKKSINKIIKHVKLGKRKPLVGNLLIIEGIGRAGKFLLANVLHGFRGIEPVQCYGLLDNIPFLERFGLIEKKVAQEILQCEIDSHCYDMIIGRNLNHRRNDKSSIFNIPSFDKYLKRCEEPDGDLAVGKFYEEKLCSMFILHDLIPNIKIYFDTFPKLKVISVQRSPVYLVYSWYKRGWGKRIGSDPKAFSLVLQEKGKNVPWYAARWGKKYLKLSEMDRCIAMIEWVILASEKSYPQLSSEYQNKILFISYEAVLTRTNEVIKKIQKFLGRSVMKSEMKIILEHEKLPNLAYSESKQEKLTLIKETSSLSYFKRLLILEEEYIKKEKMM